MVKRTLPGKKQAKPDTKLAMATLAVARKDLDASVCLYENGLYPQAVFFLQQGVEKGWKAFGYHHGVLTLEEAKSKKYGHISTNVGKTSLLRMRNVIGLMIRQMQIVYSSVPYQNKKNQNEPDSYLLNIYNQLHWAQKEIDKATDPNYAVTTEELEKMLDKFNSDKIQEKIWEEYLEYPDIYTNIVEKIREGAIDGLSTIYSGIPEANELIKETINGKYDDHKIKEILLSVMKGLVIICPLLCFGIISQRHENICRYPDRIHSPLNDYTKDHILIRYFPAITNIAEFSLEKMDELFRMEFLQIPTQKVR